MALFHELRRRQVIRVGIAYLAGSWLLIQVLETLFPVFGLPEHWIRIVVIILAIGLLPAIVGSWVFELTPRGLERDEDIPPGAITRKQSARKQDRVIIITLTIAVAYFTFDKFVLTHSDEELEADRAIAMALAYMRSNALDKTSIAVLPFSNLSADPDQEHLADGLAEEILNSLATVNNLHVTSRTSSFAFTERARAAVEANDEIAPFVILDIVPAAIIVGEREHALDLLDQAADFVEANMSRADMYSFLWRLQCNPEIRNLAGHPRYKGFLDRLELPN